jgi:transcriptional regulator with XRE-family HTH domain
MPVGRSDRERLGQRVRQLRTARGWTQEELAARASLHPTYVGSVECGERNIGLDNLIKLARALGVRPGELFNG